MLKHSQISGLILAKDSKSVNYFMSLHEVVFTPKVLQSSLRAGFRTLDERGHLAHCYAFARFL